MARQPSNVRVRLPGRPEPRPASCRSSSGQVGLGQFPVLPSGFPIADRVHRTPATSCTRAILPLSSQQVHRPPVSRRPAARCLVRTRPKSTGPGTARASQQRDLGQPPARSASCPWVLVKSRACPALCPRAACPRDGPAHALVTAATSAEHVVVQIRSWRRTLWSGPVVPHHQRGPPRRPGRPRAGKAGR